MLGRLRSTVVRPKRQWEKTCRRWGSSLSDPFDESVKQMHRRYAAEEFVKNGPEFEFLRDLVAEQIVDRIADISRDFDVAVDLGCNTGNIYGKLIEMANGKPEDSDFEVPGAVKKVIHVDPCENMLQAARSREVEVLQGRIQSEYIHSPLDSFGRQIPTASADMVLSGMSLHWANDLPQVLSHASSILKPDGVFLGAMLGGDTLFELRTALAFAEQEREGGISPHISPMVRQSDACGLLGAAGFNLTTVDTATLTVEFKDMFSCIEHLSKMGESSANRSRRGTVSRDTMFAAAAVYEALFADESGYIPATFEIIYMIGWKPHMSQPKPLKPGTHKGGALGKTFGDFVKSNRM